MTQEYHVTLKQNYLKGFMSAVLQIIKHFVLGIILPFWVFTKIKQRAHDTKNYYKGHLIQAEGSPIYNDGCLLKTIRNIRETYIKYPDADVLGRSKALSLFYFFIFIYIFFLDSANYYRVKAPLFTIPTEITNFEKDYHKCYTKNTGFGRGE